MTPPLNAPLLELELADQIFTATTPEDIDQLRSLLAEFRSDVPPRIGTLRRAVDEKDASLAKRELHQLRGVIANFALSAAAGRLRELERGWDQLTSAERTASLAEVEREVAGGLTVMMTRFSYLEA